MLNLFSCFIIIIIIIIYYYYYLFIYLFLIFNKKIYHHRTIILTSVPIETRRHQISLQCVSQEFVFLISSHSNMRGRLSTMVVKESKFLTCHNKLNQVFVNRRSRQRNKRTSVSCAVTGVDC